MKYILSWGGGVNSTAILAMVKLGMLPELTKDNTHIVFADTGAEMPYTHAHTTRCLSGLPKEGWTVVRLHSSDKRWQKFYSGKHNLTLPEYCMEKQVMPSRVNRWCTMQYKSKPIREYRKSLGETQLILGISSDEKHRAKFPDTYYPLIEQNIDRQGCIDLIAKTGLPTAKKSGCYFCPFQGKSQWLELYKEHKDLFNETEKLENIAREKFKGKAYCFIRQLPLREQIGKWLAKEKEDCKQQDLFELDRHCLCEL